jgi:hypothetical protein
MPTTGRTPKTAYDGPNLPLTKASRRLLKLSLATPSAPVGPRLYLPDAVRTPRSAPHWPNSSAMAPPDPPSRAGTGTGSAPSPQGKDRPFERLRTLAADWSGDAHGR